MSQRICVSYLRAKLERTKRKKKQTPFHPRHLAQGSGFFEKRNYRSNRTIDLTSPRRVLDENGTVERVLVTSPADDTPRLKKSSRKVAKKLFADEDLTPEPSQNRTETLPELDEVVRLDPVICNTKVG